MPQRAHPDLSLNAERRATTPAGPIGVEKTIGRASAAKDKQPPKPPALTRREQRVKRILLRELERMNGKQYGAGLTYSEKQHLQKALNPAFLDAELDKMRRQLGWLPRLLWGLGLVMIVLFGWALWSEAASGTLDWGDLFFALPVASGLIAPAIQVRSLRRKIWIYEALRELSDADEMDVTLSRVAEEADALIARIVDQELDLDDRMPAQPRSRTR